MKINKIAGLAVLTLLAACSNQQKQGGSYIVTAELPETKAEMAYLINYDTSDKIDSTAIINGVASFSGEIDEPVLVRLIVDGKRAGSFVLEEGEITVADRHAVGGELNQLMDELEANLAGVDSSFSNIPDSIPFDIAAYKEAQKKVYDKYFKSNENNPVGYYIFLQQAYDMSLDELNEAIKNNPALGDYQRISKLQSGKVAKAETSEGKPYKDFEVVYNDSTYRLSNYVGNGKYLLVDFWASWCGPCIRETKVIKEVLEKYGDKGLEVLGVAVWDEPENTLAGIEQHQLPWQQIINSQNIATDLYGIPSIPCLIVINPEGTIVARDRRGDDLKAFLADIFEPAKVE
ncbi:MAG: AhpC/TSA family protein [Muribaculaceae bacterium]|nr:AhpC/TSA family protein [Muribaculaceae bacterium]